jgi:signal transduction histidine kinase
MGLSMSPSYPLRTMGQVDLVPSPNLSPSVIHDPEAEAPSGVMMLLSLTGVVQSVQVVGPRSIQPALAATWIGRNLAEIIAFEAKICLGETLATLQSLGEEVTLGGRCPLGSHSLASQWHFQPLPGPDGQRHSIVAMGYWLNLDRLADSPWFVPVLPHPHAVAMVPQTSPTDCAQLQTYSPRLNQITRNVRWTLDLDIIRQQTVEGLGELFGVNRCIVCSSPHQAEGPVVAAEYLQTPDWASWQGQPLPTTELSHLEATAKTSLALLTQSVDLGNQAVVAVATRYQKEINGFILLYSVARPWTQVELSLITDLADQVGTAIAHATLFSESHALAIKLQQANASLMEKQREFQEARRQAEEARRQAEEASRLKSEFLANTSHELRTPLNGMIGFLRLVLDGMADDPAEQEEFIQEAHKSAIHLLDLINDVLDIAKIEAGKMAIDMGPVNLQDLLVDLGNFMRPQAEQKGLRLDILLPATRDEIVVHSNYQRLRQVLLNLMGNAIKFTHEGSVTIQAEVKPQTAEFKDKVWPGVVKISVVDTGIGVSLEKQDRLFQSFSQVDGDRTRQYGGTGLGLFISQRLVEAMGGVVQFISMGEGLGSTVTFTALLYQEPVMIDKDPVYPPTT